MLASLIGEICLLIGLSVLLLPLMATELSRPRDGAWGSVVLLLGLVLVTSSDRLRGAPMLGMLCAILLISRLGVEVGQSRWQQLSEDEQQRLGSKERWATSFEQLGTVIERLMSSAATLLTLVQPKPKPSASGKKWVRPESPGDNDTAPEDDASKEDQATAPGSEEPPSEELPAATVTSAAGETASELNPSDNDASLPLKESD